MDIEYLLQDFCNKYSKHNIFFHLDTLNMKRKDIEKSFFITYGKVNKIYMQLIHLEYDTIDEEDIVWHDTFTLFYISIDDTFDNNKLLDELYKKCIEHHIIE